MRGLRNRDIIHRVGRLTRLTHQAKAFDLHDDHLALTLAAPDGGGVKKEWEKEGGFAKAGCARAMPALWSPVWGSGG